MAAAARRNRIRSRMALVLMATERPLRILCAREIQKSIKESVKALLDARSRRRG
jgi:hypothetical protein